MKTYQNYALLGLTVLTLYSCGNAERGDRDDAATVIADSLNDTTLRAQAATADVDMNGDEKLFVLNAASGGLMEVEAATVAMSKTKNAQIKVFAERMLKDHTKANKDLEMIAEEKGLNIPIGLSGDKAEHLTMLKNLADREFDVQYMKMMIDDHQKTVDLFTQGALLPTGALKTFAANTLPVLKEHHKLALKIGKALNITNANNGDDLQGVSPAAGHTN